MTKPTTTGLAALLLALAALPLASAAAEVVPLEVGVLAREVAPGEPLRVVVRSPVPLAAASATCLDLPVTLVAVDETREVWSGWGLVDLDRKPGEAAIEVRATTAQRREARGTRAITVVDKAFPEQRLEVDNIYVEPPKKERARIQRERARLARIYETRREVPPPDRPFVSPVAGRNTSVFGERRFFNGEPSPPHSGLDLRAAEGTPVRASGPGVVALADDLYYAGGTVILDHGGGLFTIYAHLSAWKVEKGRQVEAGEVVGLSGSTGRVTGPHLHWGAKIGDRIFDPAALLDPALFDASGG